MSGTDTPANRGPSPEQIGYARLLEYGVWAGLALLIVSFAAYVAGWLPAQVPFDALPRLWSLPVGDYLRESGMSAGWGWLSMLDKGDVLALSGIAFLSGVSVPCLALLLPAYAARRDWAYLGITAAVICVLLLAAAGVFGSH